MEDVCEAAIADAQAYALGGADALMVENFGDVPFTREAVAAETVAGMAVAAGVAFSVFAHAVEIPVIMESKRGTDPQEALSKLVDRQAFVRSGVIGGVTGLFVYALIT